MVSMIQVIKASDKHLSLVYLQFIREKAIISHYSNKCIDRTEILNKTHTRALQCHKVDKSESEHQSLIQEDSHDLLHDTSETLLTILSHRERNAMNLRSSWTGSA